MKAGELQDGFLERLKRIKVQRVRSLKLNYRVNRVTAVSEGKMLFHKGKLLVRSDHALNMDSLAVELAKAFGEIPGLEDFLIALFGKSTPEDIEGLLSAKGIGRLSTGQDGGYSAKQLPQETEEADESPTETTDAETGEDETYAVESGVTGIGAATRALGHSAVSGGAQHLSGSSRVTVWQPDRSPTDVEARYAEFLPTTRSIKTRSRRSKHGETEPSKPKSHPADNQSPQERKDIGRWGEQYTLEVLLIRLQAKFPGGKPKRSDSGSTIRQNRKAVCKVTWLNSRNDRGEGHDIQMTIEGVTEYIEVKSTKTKEKDTFEVTRRQWEFAREHGKRFHIYRVYSAGTEDAEIVDIRDPVKALEDGHLVGYPMRLEI